MKYDDFIRSMDESRLIAAIQKAESATTGEIRLCLARGAEPDPLAAARRAFVRLGMDQTRDRNGVLIFVAPRGQTFAILGDEGIDQRCGADFWKELTAQLGSEFATGRWASGLEAVIATLGEVLARHFPRRPGDTNELPDQIASV
jgi:uncharacterized membrane protein